ncbi:MAG: kinase/pyrophosphorylase, partial [Bacteroidales bacterium]|nr:kinase/pyrophosphorylase [Bacteroidales bacterium]
KLDPRRVFGLTINPPQLHAHRKKRIRGLGMSYETPYLNMQQIHMELLQAESIFKKGGFSVINVTNKPVESSANEIVELISSRFDLASGKVR